MILMHVAGVNFLTLMSMKSAILWDVAPCSLIDSDGYLKRNILSLPLEASQKAVYLLYACYLTRYGCYFVLTP
jgi:hypothetical protein